MSIGLAGRTLDSISHCGYDIGMEYEWDSAKNEANILAGRSDFAVIEGLSGRQPWSFPAIGAVRCDGPRSVWWATAYTTLYL